MIPWLYDFGIWVFSLCLDIFFREIYCRGTWRIPKNGPVIVVAEPHANQFVDSAILMRNLRYYAGRRTSFLTAEKTLREPYIGTMTRLMGAVSVVRSTDLVKPAEGKIYIPDPKNDPTLIRGQETDFTNGQFMEGGLIVLPKVEGTSVEQQTIAEILGPEELRLRKPFKDFENGHPLHKPLREGTPFKVAPLVDQSQMFDAVCRKLCSGGCVGIFPEGGSHDRPSFLPLKAGVAIIALVHPDQIDAFKAGGHLKRNAVGSLLETIQEALAAVTQQAPDHETLMVIQATRRATRNYNRRLRSLGIRDHQVEWGDVEQRTWWLVFAILLCRIGEYLALALATLPSVALFWPVFVITKIVSVKKQRQALVSSVVKLEGRDVVGSWKIIVAMGLAPALYIWYTAIATVWLYYCRHEGQYANVVPWWIDLRNYIPDIVPLWCFSMFFAGLMISVSFAGLRIGEIGTDVLKSLPPLLVALHPGSANSLVKLRAERQALSSQVVEVVNTFGPEIIPDFESEKLVREDSHDDVYQSRLKSMPPSQSGSRSRSESRDSRSGSISFFLHDTLLRPLSTISKDNLGEVNRRIQDSKSKKRIRRSRRDDVSDDDLVLVDEYSSVRSQYFTEDKKSR
ncbi:uncharacterized protein PADG_00837 [Paracoccidioides brasiliensis Pb18]|uniref:Uncharacterized protein n=1 Tax=Paracoccidioides brasiliensis (strain Pb18) TaxID=502780 RepID=C1FYG1_PARBD|nr:uncharacterized protein PADG_00837 [Paracoccidioides brasiliensis Pb18]EEH44548.2 hypothetical protein PADG_00837 [Paracoccidioides brasiliensis Pb18]